MSDLSNKHISVKEYSSIKDYKDENIGEEVIEILNFNSEEAFEMEKKGFFFMPNKIMYIRETETIENVLKDLKRNKRKKINKFMRGAHGFELIKEKSVTEDNFKEWYNEIYVPNLESKKIGILLVGEDWWSKSLDKCKKLGIFFKKDGKIVSGIVAKSYKQNEFRRLSICFSATKKEFKGLGINDYLNVLMISFAKECGYDSISRGKDTNLYGKHLSVGIPVFKTSLNYEIKPYKKKPDILIKFNNLDKFDDIVFFVSYAKNSDKLIGNLILKKDIENVQDYNENYFSSLRIFKYKDNKLKLIEEIENDS